MMLHLGLWCAQVKVHLQARLDELEPLPELLKMTELKLQQAQEQLTMFERKNGENMRTIGEQQAKVWGVTITITVIII